MPFGFLSGVVLAIYVLSANKFCAEQKILKRKIILLRQEKFSNHRWKQHRSDERRNSESEPILVVSEFFGLFRPAHRSRPKLGDQPSDGFKEESAKNSSANSFFGQIQLIAQLSTKLSTIFCRVNCLKIRRSQTSNFTFQKNMYSPKIDYNNTYLT